MVLSLIKRDKILKPSECVNDYVVLEILGEGRFGICYQVSCDHKLYILKQLKRGMLKKSKKKVRFEEDILKTLYHDSIPRFIEKIEHTDFYGYILEFKEGKTFEDIIFHDNYTFSRKEIYSIGMQLINVLKYLHLKGIVHRDIRPPNVLYNDGGIYLVDFGLARMTDKKYKCDMDFAYLGDFLLHLFYTTYDGSGKKSQPWYEELDLSNNESILLKRLIGVEERYKEINEVEHDFQKLF